MATYYVKTTGSDAADGLSEGNAWLTINKAVTTATAGDLVNIKSGTYTQTATLTPTNSGTATGGTVRYRGYTTTPGDGGRPLITTATNSTILFQMSGKSQIEFEDIDFSNTAGTRAHGFSVASADCTSLMFIDCSFDGFSIAFPGDYVSYYTFFNLVLHNCEVKNCTGKSIQASSATLIDTIVHAGGDIGFEQGNYNISAVGSAVLVMVRSSFYNNAGDQVVMGRNYHVGLFASGCNFYPNASSRDCIDISSTTGRITVVLENCIFYPGTSGYGINAATVKPIVSMKNCAFGPTGTNYAANITAGTGEITLSGVPWTSAPTDWSLDNTASEGAACRAAGFPGALLSGGTGYIDLGALQHQDAGGTDTGYVGIHNVMQINAMRAVSY